MADFTKLLSIINRFGYLKNKDIAGLLFADDVRKAQRLTQKAVAEGVLVERKLPNGSRFTAPKTKELLNTVTGHRDAANAIAIDALLTGLATEIVTDREIQLNQPAFTLHDKIPDTLLLDRYETEGEDRTDFTWVEVENSEKSGRDVAIFGDWLMGRFLSTRNWNVLPEYRTGYMSTVLVVVSSPAADKIESRLMNYINKKFTNPWEVAFIKEMLPKRLQFIRV